MIAPGVSARAEPLVASAALALGPAATRLLERLLQLDDARLLRLRGVAGDGLVLICGAAADLPWSDGVLYLGRDDSAPRLLLPTTTGPNLPSALLERAVARRFEDRASELTSPWAVCFEPPLLIPTGNALPLSRDALEAWRAERAGETIR